MWRVQEAIENHGKWYIYKKWVMKSANSDHICSSHSSLAFMTLMNCLPSLKIANGRHIFGGHRGWEDYAEFTHIVKQKNRGSIYSRIPLSKARYQLHGKRTILHITIIKASISEMRGVPSTDCKVVTRIRIRIWGVYFGILRRHQHFTSTKTKLRTRFNSCHFTQGYRKIIKKKAHTAYMETTHTTWSSQNPKHST